jgi:VWFA-related protein
MPHNGSGRTVLLILSLLALLAGQPTPAQQDDQPPPGSALEERVRVRVRMIDFLVVDPKGRPVVDLRKEEVELWDGGEKQEVLDLLPAHAIGDGASLYAAPDSQPPASADSSPAGSREDRVDRRWIVLLFDVGNLSFQGRVRAGLALRGLAENALSEGDRVALMVDEDELRVVVPFTTRHEQLLPYLQNPEGISTRSRDLERRLSDLRDDAESCRDAPDPVRCAQQAGSSFVFETSRETEAGLAHLEALLRGLAAIPDRKILFYVSEGLLINPGDVATAAVQHAIGQVGYSVNATELFLMRDYRPRLDALYQVATDSRTGFYIVNTSRKMTDDLFSAERALEGGPENLPQARTDPFEASWQQVHKLHSDLARATGGLAVFRRDPEGFLKGQLDASDGVYTISYAPSRYSFDKTKIKIKVSRNKTRVLYRNTYNHVASRTRRLLGDLTVAQSAADRANNMVRANLKVAGDYFSVVPESDPPISIVSLFFDLRSAEGRPLKDSYELIAFPRGEKGRISQDELKRPFALKVPSGKYRLRVDVSDIHGAARGSFYRSFSVGRGAELDGADSLGADPPVQEKATEEPRPASEAGSSHRQ